MSKNKNRNNYNTSRNESETIMSNESSTVSSSITSATSAATSNVNSVPASSVTSTAANVTAKKGTTQPAQTKSEELTPNVQKIDKLLKNFADAVTRQSLMNNSKYDSIAVMISICQFLNTNNDPAVFEYFFRFFQRNQRGIMYHDKALYGIHTIQNKLVKSRVSATHAAFVELCRVRSLQKGTFKFTINAMKIMGISDILGRWIIAKSENRK